MLLQWSTWCHVELPRMRHARIQMVTIKSSQLEIRDYLWNVIFMIIKSLSLIINIIRCSVNVVKIVRAMSHRGPPPHQNRLSRYCWPPLRPSHEPSRLIQSSRDASSLDWPTNTLSSRWGIRMPRDASLAGSGYHLLVELKGAIGCAYRHWCLGSALTISPYRGRAYLVVRPPQPVAKPRYRIKQQALPSCSPQSSSVATHVSRIRPRWKP
jgi:hypothetical protein